MAYIGNDLQLPFDPTGYTTIDGAQLAQLTAGLAPITGLTGMVILTTDVAGVPSVPSVATYPKLAAYPWIRVGTNGATLYIWNPNGAIDPVLSQWQVANISSIANGTITGNQLAALTVLDGNIGSVGWSKLPNGGAVGGCLVGSMPNPQLANSAVGNTNVAPLSIDATKLIGSATLGQLFTSDGAGNITLSSPAATQVVTAASTGINGAAAFQTKIAHTLGVVPSRVRITLYCNTIDANSGYVVGQELGMDVLVSSTNLCYMSYYVDASYVYINCTTPSQIYMVTSAGTASVDTIAAGHFNWKVYLGV